MARPILPLRPWRWQLLLLLLPMTVVVLVQAQSSNNTSTTSTSTWSGCVMNGNSNSSSNLIRTGDPTRVCLQVANGLNWAAGVSYVRAAFQPKADQYSRLHIPNSYRDLVLASSSSNSIFAGNATITLGAASQSALSFVRVYYDPATERVYPFLTAVMDVDRGVVRGITWDNACVFCGGLECVENTYDYNGIGQNQSASGQATQSCYVTRASCDELLATQSNSTTCDITLYTVWSGTDVDGIALQSQAFRFSAFPAQELSDRLTQLLPNAAKNALSDDAAAGSGQKKQRRTLEFLLEQQQAHATTVAGVIGGGRDL